MDIYDERINTTFKSWDPKTGQEWDNGPCGKCHPQACLDEFNGYSVWQCSHGSWFVEQDDEPVKTPEDSHSHLNCPGNCHQHPLMVGEHLEITRRMRAGGPSCTTWGDIMWEEEQRRPREGLICGRTMKPCYSVQRLSGEKFTVYVCMPWY
jgi:hypothetical protein